MKNAPVTQCLRKKRPWFCCTFYGGEKINPQMYVKQIAMI